MMANLKLKREINVGSVRVHGNCMEFGNTAVQLSNISSLSTSEVKRESDKGSNYFTCWLCVVVCSLAARVQPLFWWEFSYFLQSCKTPNISYLSQQMLVGIFQSYLKRLFLNKVHDILIEIIAKS